MPAKCKEICIQVLHVHFHVRYALRTVYQDRDTVTVSRCNHLLHRIHSTEHIANMHQTHQFCTFRKSFSYASISSSPLSFIGITFSTIPLFSACNCQGTILLWCHGRNNHLVAFLHLTFGKGRSQQVDTFSSSPCKHDFIRTACIDKLTDCFTRGFV